MKFMIRRFFEHLHEVKIAEKAIQDLMEKSRLEWKFFVMCVLSSILATLGILLNDTSILIAAMVLAPLLNPILAFAAGISIRNRDLIFYASKSFFGSIIFAILTSALFIKLLLIAGYQFDISYFLEKFAGYYDLFYIAAFVSGFAGVYSWLKASDVAHLVGVAIAVSLIPFVSFFGILVGMGEFNKIEHIYLNFLLNLATILLGAIFAFLILGFSSFRRQIQDEIEDNGKKD